MRLLTHNLLACLQCEQFPLKVVPAASSSCAADGAAVELLPVEFSEVFTRKLLSRIDYDIFLSGVESYRAGYRAALQATVPNEAEWKTMYVVEVEEIKLSAVDVLELALPASVEALSTALTIQEGRGEEKEGESESVFLTSDPVQQRLMLLLHTLLEGLAVRRGVLKCSECESEYTINDFIPSFVKS